MQLAIKYQNNQDLFFCYNSFPTLFIFYPLSFHCDLHHCTILLIGDIWRICFVFPCHCTLWKQYKLSESATNTAIIHCFSIVPNACKLFFCPTSQLVTARHAGVNLWNSHKSIYCKVFGTCDSWKGWSSLEFGLEVLRFIYWLGFWVLYRVHNLLFLGPDLWKD